MKIIFSLEAPAALSFKNLYDTTNWGPIERDVGFYADALRGSWASVSAYDGDRLVGFADEVGVCGTRNDTYIQARVLIVWNANLV